MRREAGGGMEEVRKCRRREAELEVVKSGRDRRGGSYAVVHKIAYINLTQGRVLNANLG